MGRLEGRSAVVTGAASGIGEGIAGRFAEEGAKEVVARVDGAPIASRRRGQVPGATPP